MAKKKLTPEKAREMLHNPPHGKPLTEKQRKYFGAISNMQLGGFVYPVNYVPQKKDGGWLDEFEDAPKAQFGINSFPTNFLIEKAASLFGGNKYSRPDEIDIKDLRKIRKTTNKKIDPNSDLVSGKYDTRLIGEMLEQAKEFGISKEDAWNLAAIGLQESGWGKTDENLGHVLGDVSQGDTEHPFINAYLNKMRDADRLKITNPELRLQVYNGLGVVKPETEENYHGFKMKKIYGVPVPKEGINMKKTPLYGRQIIDIRDNVLKKNPEVVKFVDSYYPEEKQYGGSVESHMGGLTDKGFNYNGAWGGPSMQMGGTMPGSVGFTYARTINPAPSKGPYAKKTMASAQDGTSTKKPTVKLSPDELKMERLKQYAQQQSRKEQPSVQSRGSMPDALRKQLYEDAQSAELKNQLLKGADIATDVMQVGNFVPHPTAQIIGKIGNTLGSWIDGTQAALDAYDGNYGSAAINAASAVVPSFIQNPNVLGGYRRPAKYNFGNRSFYNPVDKRYGRMTKKQLMGNRALLGTLGAETVYDSYQNGGEMKFYQEGLDWTPKNISRDGSEIRKDDMGYWNPENWGKPVEIGSNEITMQGVDQPLLGISDTGDTQMMYPDKNYKFKGKKVVEYPVTNWLDEFE